MVFRRGYDPLYMDWKSTDHHQRRTEYNTTQIVKDRCTALLPWWSTSTNQDYILQELALLVNSFFGTVVFLQLETGMGNDPIFTVLQTVA